MKILGLICLGILFLAAVILFVVWVGFKIFKKESKDMIKEFEKTSKDFFDDDEKFDRFKKF